MIAMISPSSDVRRGCMVRCLEVICWCLSARLDAQNYDETMSTLRYAESAKRVINRAVVNEDKNARIIRQLRQEIQELRLELEHAKLNTPRRSASSSSGADATASGVAEREEFVAQLVQEVEQLRSLQAQLPPPPPPPLETGPSLVSLSDETQGAVHVHKTLPSLLVDITKQHLRTGGALAYALAEGTTVFGSVPHGQNLAGNDGDREKELAVETLSSDEMKETAAASSPPKRRWSPTFLRRKTSPSPTSATAKGAGGKSPQCTAPRLSMSSRRSTSGTMTLTKFYELPPDSSVGDTIAAQHVWLHCTRASAADSVGDTETPSYTVEVEAADATARVFLNGMLLSAEDGRRVRMRHADRLQLGDSCFFTLHGAFSRAAAA